MPGFVHHNDSSLQSALGKPKYYVDAPDKKPGEQYYWFPTAGNSMTDRSATSIPSGSLVLGRLLQVQSVNDLPLLQPVVVIIDDGGQQFCMLKLVCEVRDAEFCLRSYNKIYDDFWLPFSCLQFAFVVERIKLPNGNEFVPGAI